MSLGFSFNSYSSSLTASTKFKDSTGNIYFVRSLNTKTIKLRCQGKICKVKAVYDIKSGTVRFSGKHSDHPVNENVANFIEFSQLMRARAFDSKNNQNENINLYTDGVSMLKDITLPTNQEHKLLESIANRRNKLRKKKLNDEIKEKVQQNLRKKLKQSRRQAVKSEKLKTNDKLTQDHQANKSSNLSNAKKRSRPAESLEVTQDTIMPRT